MHEDVRIKTRFVNDLSTLYISEMVLNSFFTCLFPVHTTMKSALCMLTTEKERLKQMLEHESCPSPSAQLLGLKSALTAVRTQTHTHIFSLCISLCSTLFTNNRSVSCLNTSLKHCMLLKQSSCFVQM